MSARHTAIRTYLANNHPGFKDAKLIGSLQRKTRIKPDENAKFDIDIVVVLGEFYSWVSFGGVTPQAALLALHSTVADSARYLNMNPVQNAPTVSLTSTDKLEVQLVPAYIDMVGADPNGNQLGFKGRGYWVAKNGTWEMADYDYEAKYITDRNELSDGYLVPLAKMLKAIKRIYFPALGSFPLEIIASQIVPVSVTARKSYNQGITYAQLLLDFFTYAPAYLDKGLSVPGSKSTPIYLGAQNAAIKQMFESIAAYIRALETSPRAAQIEGWRKLCGDCFPVATAATA